MNQKRILKICTSLLIAFTMIALITDCKSNKSAEKEIKSEKTNSISNLTDDGAWCWFSDPRAIYYSENKIVTGWVKKDGSIETAMLNIKTGEKEFEIINSAFEIDDHDNPAFAILSNGNIIAMYAWHSSKKGVISNTTSDGANVHSFEEM